MEKETTGLTEMMYNLEELTGWGQLKHDTWAYLTDAANWMAWLTVGIKIVAILIAGRLATQLTRKTVLHMAKERERNPLKIDARRTRTIGKLIGNLISTTVNFMVLLLILSQLGLNLAPLLAGAGILGLAIGFGAQSLVKDIITGFFILFEDQFAVGDVIQTGTYKGTVEEIGLRVTRIRGWAGELYMIPNGSITQVTNYSNRNAVAIADVTVSYEADLEKVLQVTKDTVRQMYERSELIVKEPLVLGVQAVTNSEVTLRVTAECRPNAQAEVLRELNVELMRALGQYGFKKISS